MRITHYLAKFAVVLRLLDRHRDCKTCGGCIWSGMQATLLLSNGKELGIFCCRECLDEYYVGAPVEAK